MDAFLMKKRSGQTTIEYILLVTAVLIVGIAFAAKNGPLAQGVNKTLKMPMTSLSSSGLMFNQVN
ncbi:MAG: hypothetical protein WCO69_02340 [Candidatus Omnitrophota bacterium]